MINVFGRNKINSIKNALFCFFQLLKMTSKSLWVFATFLLAVHVQGAAQRAAEVVTQPAAGGIKNLSDAPIQDNSATAVAAQSVYKNPGQPVAPSSGPSAPSAISAPSAPANSIDECDPEMIGFELVTG